MSSRALNIAGQRYGRLVAIEEASRTPAGLMTWRCVCDCGGEVIVRGSSLRSGNTKSCGCHKLAVSATLHMRHGACSGGEEDDVYVVWKGMRQRCLNPNNPSWPYYGGRGIKICQQWQDNYRAFARDMGVRPRGYTVERINTNGDYEPDNCIWATRKRQSRNRRDTVRITLCGEMVALVDACERFGMNNASVMARVKREGQSPTEAFYFLLDRKLSLGGETT